MRKGIVSRTTKETEIKAEVSLEGNQVIEVNTPFKFLNHLLELLFFHGMMDAKISSSGDLTHHIIEDTALVLGKCIDEALGNRTGISRYSDKTIPMDEALARVVIDLGCRPYCVVNIDCKRTTIEDVAAEDIIHFIESFALALRANIHVNILYGSNAHHIIEAVFKALGRALKEASTITSDFIPSSKGVI